MRRTRRSPPPERTPQQREAARLEREARRAARAGEPAPAPPPETASAEPEPPPGAPASASAGRARNTAIFSVLTGLSRIAGLGREIVAAAYYGTGGAASAFTLAFQVPNLIRALVADAALSSAFVPVFSELLERKRRREALHAASAMAGLLLVALTLITLAFIALAPVVMPLVTGDEFTRELDDLTVGLSRVLFPIVVLLGLNGLVVGILNAHVHRVLTLMLPVSLGLGLINVSLVLNSSIGSLISDNVPRAIDAAFRIYMLPQGMFSVAVATVLFPALSRLASRRDLPGLRGLTGTGMRQIALLLIPSAAAILALSEPMVRLVYERGEFDAGSTELVSEALFWFAFSLPFSGVNLLLTRTFFSLQQPWMPTRLAVWSLVVNVVVSLALYEPLGIGGIVIGTTVSNAVMMALLATRLRRELGGLEVARTLRAAANMLAAGALLGGIAYGVWWLVDRVLGDALIAQLIAVGLALALGAAAYGAAVLASGLPEARQILELFMR